MKHLRFPYPTGSFETPDMAAGPSCSSLERRISASLERNIFGTICEISERQRCAFVHLNAAGS